MTDRMVTQGDAREMMLSVAEVALRLRVSPATVHRLIAIRELEHVRIGVRTIRVPETALEDYLERRTVRHLR